MGNRGIKRGIKRRCFRQCLIRGTSGVKACQPSKTIAWWGALWDTMRNPCCILPFKGKLPSLLPVPVFVLGIKDSSRRQKKMHLPVKRLDVSFWPQGPKSSDLKNTLLKGNMFFSQHRISRKTAFTWCLQDIFIHVKFIIFQAHLKSCQQTAKSRNLWHDPLKSPWTFQVWVTFQLPQVPLESMAEKKIGFHWFLGEWLCGSFGK